MAVGYTTHEGFVGLLGRDQQLAATATDGMREARAHLLTWRRLARRSRPLLLVVKLLDRAGPFRT